MTAAERSELAEFRQEMNGRFDSVDDRLRSVEGFVANQQGRESARRDISANRLVVFGVIAAVAAVVVGLPAAVVYLIHLAAL